jgi:hypothetical protein
MHKFPDYILYTNIWFTNMRYVNFFLMLTAVMLTSAHVQAQEDDLLCFEQTGHCIAGDIREYWQQNGALPVFGLPISPQYTAVVEGSLRQVQRFERARMELHPENAPPYHVLLSRLGAEVLQQQNRNWYTFPRAEGPADGCRYFEQTGQNVCGALLDAWQSNGLDLNGNGIAGDTEAENLALSGLPLGGEMTEQPGDGGEYTVQWFERIRLELHPENDPPYNVLAGLLGRELAPPPPVNLPVIDMFLYPDEQALTDAWQVASSGSVTLNLVQDTTAADPQTLRLTADLPCMATEDDRYMRLIRRFPTPQDFSTYNSLVIRARGDGESVEPFGGEFSVILWDAAGFQEEKWQSTRWLQRGAGWQDYVIALRDAGLGNPWDHAEDFVFPRWDEPVNAQFDRANISAIGIIASTTSEECATYPAMTTWIDSIILR